MAYAAVNSLKNTIKRLKSHMNPQIRKSAKEELNSLRYMLKQLDKESSRRIDRSVINELDKKIREAVWKLEDVLESYHSLNISPSQGDGEESCSGIPLVDEMEMEMEMEMDLFLKKVKMLGEEYYRVLQNPLSGEEEEDEAAAVPPVNKSTTVGFSDLSQDIINQLLHGEDSHRKIVSRIGMAGIGKTHLAIDIYGHLLIVQHFHSRVWVSVGPKGLIMHNTLVDILSQIDGKPKDLFKEKDENTLADLFQNSVPGRRCLFVFDDIWSEEVFKSITWLFIGFANGSRILLITTRLHDIIPTHYIHDKFCLMNRVPFLDNEESWNLLWQNVFVAEKSFPPKLEKPGRKIAENCEGLPLLILTIANILRELDKTKEYWEKVAQKNYYFYRRV